MDLVWTALSVTSSLVAQACCWWHCFKCCGCIEDEQQRQLQHQEPQVIDTRPIENKNPFQNPSAPKDAHLQSAYI